MMMDTVSSTYVILVEAILSSLSIVAGIIADLKFGRYTVLWMSVLIAKYVHLIINHKTHTHTQSRDDYRNQQFIE